MTHPPADSAFYALGLLEEPERSALVARLGADAAARTDLARTEAGLTDFAATATAGDSAVGAAGLAHVRARLLRSLDGAERFHPFVSRLEALLGLPAIALKRLFARADSADEWTTVAPGIEMITRASDPSPARGQTTLLRLAAGRVFPRHRHLGPELAFVLEGNGDDGGHDYGPGDVIEHETGSAHDFTAGADRGVLLLIAHNGITFE